LKKAEKSPEICLVSKARCGCADGFAAAFSLIELLIVIAVISLLLSIGLPAFSRCRSLAEQAVCQSHLRQWGLAFELYANNNNDYYPHIDGSDRLGDETPTTMADKADLFGWVEVLPPMWGDKPWRDYEPWQHPTGDTFFQCPAPELVPDQDL